MQNTYTKKYLGILTNANDEKEYFGSGLVLAKHVRHARANSDKTVTTILMGIIFIY